MLDTNIAGALIRTKALDAKIYSISPNAVVISSVTAAELQYGFYQRLEAKLLGSLIGAFLKTVKIVPFDEAAAQVYGELRSQFERSGISVSGIDGLIAAHALATDCTLVTKDKAVLKLRPWIRVEEW